ncbi:MAG: hypothetical protein ACYC5X_15665 [Syntrophales bacterium]
MIWIMEIPAGQAKPIAGTINIEAPRRGIRISASSPMRSAREVHEEESH